MTNPTIVYHRNYNMRLFGFERLHPFDSRKYGRAWKVLKSQLGNKLAKHWRRPRAPSSESELLEAHDPAYLQRLRDPAFLARALEVPFVATIPVWLTDHAILKPMRWAVSGTILAAQLAMEHGLSVNLSGGYHHASYDKGHGFCVYADVALAIKVQRRLGRIGEDDRIIYIDLDAHQGDGICRDFMDDRRVWIFDQFNSDIFPQDDSALRRIDCPVPLESCRKDEEYLGTLQQKLPTFLDKAAANKRVALAIYNAGTDVYFGDRLGLLSVSAVGVARRDRFIIEQLVSRGLPALVVLSGGYSAESYKMIAEMVSFILRTWG